MDVAAHVANHSSATPAQLALIGCNIDRLVTVEAHISPTSRNGMPAEASYAIVAMLGCIVRNGVAPGFKRAF